MKTQPKDTSALEANMKTWHVVWFYSDFIDIQERQLAFDGRDYWERVEGDSGVTWRTLGSDSNCFEAREHAVKWAVGHAENEISKRLCAIARFRRFIGKYMDTQKPASGESETGSGVDGQD